MSYRIPLIRPYISKRVKTMINEVLDSGYLTEGPVTRQFESAVAGYTGAGHAVAFTSCTTGLETALRVLGVGPGDEVIVPDFTYPATAGAVQIVGATPVIVDVDPDTMLMTPELAEEAISASTKVIIPVSLFGLPFDHDGFTELKKKYEVWILEDAACALGSVYKGKRTGTLADISVFSFHPRKFITTGEGGMVTTDNGKWAEAMNRYKHFGMGKPGDRGELVFLTPGTNYKMSNVQAAIGLAQMEDIDNLLAERMNLAEKYTRLLEPVKSIQCPVEPEYISHSWQSYTVFVKGRDDIMRKMRNQGIEVQIGTYALHMHPAFQDGNAKLRGQFHGSIRAFEEALVLPMYHGMTSQEQTEVVEKLSECVE
ncbi:DegT/DnrJ/EryC1/StrS family aminotransferase [Marinilabilia rubra]|uniref:Aminotransferase DegT n=1 Tax=Marinilabilia rubra TaxID=2162893 RepID=A0A2U2BB97_9BACT|nr:DegT/DnrJ/EryC1/StrS family aminotransferase [Marinilabilia rubra]PWE00345.1 aminotransferase DegT [Marinilabilia rubra]